MHHAIKVLYVEDNPDNRLLVRRVLQAEGFTIAEATTAREAHDVLETYKPDIILMDISMPDVDGFTLTAQLKKRGDLNGVPIVALTANVMRGDRERSLDAGCDGYIQKPINVDGFVDQILQFLPAQE